MKSLGLCDTEKLPLRNRGGPLRYQGRTSAIPRKDLCDTEKKRKMVMGGLSLPNGAMVLA